MNEPIRLRYANKIVGLFLMAVLILCVVVSVRLITRIAIRKDRFFIEVTEDIASQLRTGTEVLILGRTVGEVDELNYVDGSNLVRITLAIDSRQSDLITDQSQVELDRKYGIGPPVIRIARASDLPPLGPDSIAKPIEPGESIPYFKQDDDQVENTAINVQEASQAVAGAADRISDSLQQTIDPTFRAGEETFDSVRETSEAVRPEAVQTLAQLRATTAQLEDEITKLTRRVDQLVDTEIRQTIADINRSAIAATEAAHSVRDVAMGIDENADKTTADIAETLETLRQTALRIQTLTEETRDVVRIVRSEADDLPGTTERINNAVDDAQDLVGDINDHWLLRRYQDRRSQSKQVSPSSVHGGGVR
ncbi:MlaD family protein [Roseiconus lacunae]|uniref:MlaD family protein n=1 Tax=Roseiconus lacunae TaxID=2605694 RepID=A0ABT7PGZ0_9BACT|nr:MlaD family protein [Roseiconus lacunae]MCD0458761.1 MlaD family protein [Roseiconus lacunae]MDM4015741.1 MlaD family protein [Roseiconus lacunae]